MRQILVTTILLCALPNFTALAENNVKETVGKVIATKGKVEISRNEKQLTAKRKSELKEFDKITTSDKARAQFSFNDGTITTLGANSEMHVEQYKWREGESRPEAKFTLTKGVFRTITGLITNVKDPKFNVQTPMGSIGIRGTDFWGGYLDEHVIDVLFVEGEHTIEVSNEFGTVILEKPGQGTTITAGKAPSKPKTWPSQKVQRAVKTITID